MPPAVGREGVNISPKGRKKVASSRRKVSVKREWKGLDGAAARLGLLPIQVRWIRDGLIEPPAALAEILTESDATRRDEPKQKRPFVQWKCDCIEDVYELAARSGQRADHLARLLHRNSAATEDLAQLLAEETGVPKYDWMFPEKSKASVFTRPLPHWDDFLPKPVVTSRLAAELWGREGAILCRASEARIAPLLLAHVIYRRLGVRSLEWAERLSRASGGAVSATEFLRNRNSTHPAFIGDPVSV